MKDLKTLAIIPARGGSTGIKRKNLQIVGDRPLVAHAIRHAIDSKKIGQVFVSTEDEEIRQVSLSFGAQVIDRPERFIHDNSVQEVDRLLRWTVLELEHRGMTIDTVVLLYPTAPLRTVEEIDAAIRMIHEEGYDSVLSVYADDRYLWKKEAHCVKPINYDPAKRGPRQMENWNQWAENKAIYAFTRNLLVQTKCRLGGKIGAIEMPKWRSVDIDTPMDLQIVRQIATSDWNA